MSYWHCRKYKYQVCEDWATIITFLEHFPVLVLSRTISVSWFILKYCLSFRTLCFFDPIEEKSIRNIISFASQIFSTKYNAFHGLFIRTMNILLIIFYFGCNEKLSLNFGWFHGRALSSQPPPYQVLKKGCKKLQKYNDDDSAEDCRLHGITFTFQLSIQSMLSDHYQAEAPVTEMLRNRSPLAQK